MSGPQGTARRSIVRASKEQRKLLFLAYEADKTPSKPRLDDLSSQTGLSPDWISRWFARQKRSDKKREAQGCVDLTVKRELLDEAPTIAASLPPGTRKAARRKPKKHVKKEETPEAPPLPLSSPSLRWSSPMLPSSSPPRTPTHIAGPAQAWIYGDPLASPFHRHTCAYTSVGDSFLGPQDADASKSRTGKAEDKGEAFWISSFTSRTLPGDVSVSGNSADTSIRFCEHVGPRGNGSATSICRLDLLDDAIGVHSIAHEDSSASRRSAFNHSILGDDRSAAPAAAHPGADDGLELMMEELLSALEAETDVVKIAVLLSQLHRLGLRW